MVEIREKRSVSIPPIRIDKELFVRVGDILKAECPKKHRLSIEIDADSKEIKTEEPKELESIEIPSDTYSITMNIYSEELKLEFFNPVEIEIDLRRPKDSKIRIMGKDATWVRGVTDRLAQEFDKKKLGYRYIAKNEYARTAMSWISSVLLAYSIGSILWFFKIEAGYVFLFGLAFFFIMTELTKRFFNWVFPYFEIESKQFLPPKVRKLTLTILFGSGIIPALVLRIFGL